MTHDASFEYIETRDPALLAKYVELRRRAYLREYPWLSPDFGFEDETDRVSRIVVAVRQGVVAGGARLTISTLECPRTMPLEEASFSLRDCDLLKEFHLDQQPYGEISRMAADPGCARGFAVSSGLGDTLCAIAASAGLDVVFSICPEIPARINQRNARRRGVDFHKYLRLPTVFGADMWLCAFTGLLQVYGSREREVA